ASLATHSTRRHLPLAAMETPRADYRADLGWIPVLLHPQRQPEHTRDQQYRSDRWPAVPALDYCAAVLAQRQQKRVYGRTGRRYCDLVRFPGTAGGDRNQLLYPG